MGSVTKLDKIVKDLTEANEEAIQLLISAKLTLGNDLGHCKAEGCTVNSPCHACKQRMKVYDRIDQYLNSK